MPRVALHTLGCKVNQYETEKIAESFRLRGFELVDFTEKADIYVINSCTVTHTADSKSRQAARAAIHRNPEAKVILTGCYAETSPEEAAAVDGICMVVGNRDKHLIAERVMEMLPDASVPGRAVCAPVLETAKPRGRTRALLKIQDGCDQYCSYCAIPFARSEMWSKPLPEVVSEVRDLAERGYKEIVLTGIRLGRYEHGDSNLTSLIAALADVPGIERIRLSSIEVTDIPEDLLDLIAANRKVCRHLHIPLQCGDDAVLSRMNRPYNTTHYAAFVEKARAAVPEIAITTDIMVGFPGETDAEFENSHRFAEAMRFSRMHVFRYSPRSRTAAASMPGKVAAPDKEQRSARLMAISAAGVSEFAEALVGKTVSVLVEGKTNGEGMYSGLTDNYVRVFFETTSDMVGEIVDIRVTGSSAGSAFGTVAQR